MFTWYLSCHYVFGQQFGLGTFFKKVCPIVIFILLLFLWPVVSYNVSFSCDFNILLYRIFFSCFDCFFGWHKRTSVIVSRKCKSLAVMLCPAEEAFSSMWWFFSTYKSHPTASCNFLNTDRHCPAEPFISKPVNTQVEGAFVMEATLNVFKICCSSCGSGLTSGRD